MKKNALEPFDEEPPVVETERWYIETNPRRFGWREWFFLAVLLAGAILLAFGFLIIAGLLLMGWMVFSLITFVMRKLSI